MNIRPFKITDSTAISAFMKTHFLEDLGFIARSHEADYYAWKYGRNPAGKPIVWIAEEDDELAGFFGVVPKRFWIHDKEVLCGEMVDAFLSPKFQGRGVFQKLVRNVFDECHKIGIEYLLGSPNEIARPIWVKRYGFREIFDYRSMVRPFNFSSIIRKKIKNRLLSKLLMFPISFLFRLIFQLYYRDKSIALEEITLPDKKIDGVWKACMNGYLFSLVKSSDYLKWRYQDNPEFYRYYLVRKEDKPYGFVIVKINTLKSYTFAHLVDILFPFEDKKFLKCMVSELILSFKENEIDFLSTWAVPGTTIFRYFKRIGFFVRKKKFYMVIRSEKEGEVLTDEVDHRDYWQFCQGDTDGI
jgi:GNAT superfamily N-acetyltransferase